MKPQVFGKYLILKRIASGGMGEICLAKLKGPVGFEKLLVIKRILQHHLENQDFVDMFFAEARVAAQLHHSNIVQIYEMGEIADSYYIAMEYVQGKSLRDMIDLSKSKGERVAPGYVVEVIAKLCSGMSYAHNARNMSGDAIGVVHRDLNPQNLLISYNGEVKIIDFGIAKSEMNQNKTETGTIKGKFVYMSPEQSAAEKLDKRSDIFSIGICLYEALTGQNPFAKSNVVLSLDAIQREDPPPLSSVDASLAPFDPIIAKALHKDRTLRYQDAAELGDALQGLFASGAVVRPPQTLSTYMHSRFADQIAEEEQLIADTDTASTEQLESIQQYQSFENTNPHRAARFRTQPDLTPIMGVSTLPPKRSRAPFFVMLISIMLVSGVGASMTLQMGRRARLQRNEQLAKKPATFFGEDRKVGVPPPPRDSPSDSKREAPQEIDEESDDEEQSAEAQAEQDDEAHKLKREETAKRNKRKSRRKAAAKQAAKEPTGFGALQISTVPPVRIFRSGTPVSQTIRLDKKADVLVFGSGKDPRTDPFKVKIRYTVNDNGSLNFAITSSPWAVLRGNGVGLGRTPLPRFKGQSRTVLELNNPDGRQLRITLRYTR